MNRILFILFVIYFTQSNSANLMANEESSLQIGKALFYLSYGNIQSSNKEIVEYNTNDRLYLNSYDYLTGTEKKNDFNLNIFGIGFRYNLFKNYLIDLFYKNTLEKTKVSSFNSVIYKNGVGTIPINEVLDSYLLEYTSIGVIFDYSFQVIDRLNLLMGLGIEIHRSIIEPASLGAYFYSYGTTNLIIIGADYTIVKDLNIRFEIKHENMSKINYLNYYQNINPLLFDLSLGFKL